MISTEIKTIDLKESERQRCEVWTRVMGYHRPVSEFNPGKKGEHYERRHFIEPRFAPAEPFACCASAA